MEPDAPALEEVEEETVLIPSSSSEKSDVVVREPRLPDVWAEDRIQESSRRGFAVLLACILGGLCLIHYVAVIVLVWNGKDPSCWNQLSTPGCRFCQASWLLLAPTTSLIVSENNRLMRRLGVIEVESIALLLVNEANVNSDLALDWRAPYFVRFVTPLPRRFLRIWY